MINYKKFTFEQWNQNRKKYVQQPVFVTGYALKGLFGTDLTSFQYSDIENWFGVTVIERITELNGLQTEVMQLPIVIMNFEKKTIMYAGGIQG